MNNTGLVSGNAQNNATDKAVRTRSKFNMSYNHLQTARFGEINSHFVMEAVPSDKISLRSAHELRTFTLKAPLMQDIEIKKDYFSVPMEAILPLNWEKIYTNPTKGDDIDASQYGTSVLGFYANLASCFNKLYSALFDNTLTNEERLEAILRFCTLGNLIYSSGSLMHQLGYHISLESPYKNNPNASWDDYVDAVFGLVATFAGSFDISFANTNGNTIFFISEDINVKDPYKVSSRFAFDYLQNNSDWHIEANSGVDYSGLIADIVAISSTSYDVSSFGTDIPVNLARVLAYQIVCAHFYSNDSIDYIYSADLFRQFIFSLADTFNSGLGSVTAWYHNLNFTYNGVSSPVDFLSAAIFNYLTTRFINSANVFATYSLSFYQYLQSILGFKNSLRYLDYFTGSKAQPLAVGNVDANVVGGKVSIIDVTRNIQIQKFLNSVNRTGRKFSNYIEGLFGNKVAYDYHNPAYIAHTADKAVAYEVENTGADQLTKEQTVTSVARSNAEKFAFDFECDRPSIVLGVFYFDIARNYSTQVDKHIYHVDRFDMFNPYLQFIGDQEVARRELDITLPAQPFGYQLRYAEYKQRVNTLDGGFVQYLPGFAFNASEKDFQSVGGAQIRPSFIRSHPWELDEFYISLAYRCLGGYFHFIIKNRNEVEASRPMAFAPSIL